jgi:hypothetical protein
MVPLALVQRGGGKVLAPSEETLYLTESTQTVTGCKGNNEKNERAADEQSSSADPWVSWAS